MLFFSIIILQMLPTTLVTLFSFLLELCSTSPVYNMQPAYITANIGKLDNKK